MKVLVIALLGLCVASGMVITAPTHNATISGIYTFGVDASPLRSAVSMEYRIGSLSLGFATVPPFNFSWNTGYATDGNYSVTAIAYDSKGNILATAETVANVNNHTGKLVLNSPNLAKSLSGMVSISVTGTDPGTYYPARWNVFIDGDERAVMWTDQTGTKTTTTSTTLDTTVVPNGKHELHIMVASNYWPAGQKATNSWHDYRIGLSRTFVTDNGHKLMGVAANYQHVYLHPGASLLVQCRKLFTDNVTGSCSAPSYSSSDASVISVSAGKLTAGTGEGFATITLADSGKTTLIYAWVMNSFHIAHFSGSGRMLTSYQPQLSFFPIAPFVLQPSDLQQNSALVTEVKRAAVNTLYSGFYQNPHSTTAEYDRWQSNYDSGLGASWTWVANNGFHLYVMGDEIARGIGGEAWWTLNWPSAQQAVQHAMRSLASSGVAVGADIIDEGSMMWGGTPTPKRRIGEPTMFSSVTCGGTTCRVNWPNNPVIPGRFYAGVQFAFTGSVNPNLNTPAGQMFTATNITSNSFDFAPAAPVTGTFTTSNDPNLEFLWWAGSAGGCPTAPCNPPVPNTALLTIATWLRSAIPHVAISWPALGIAAPMVHDNWAGKDSTVSDYMSHYWDSHQAGRTYAWGSGITERVRWMRDIFYSRQIYVNFAKPQIILDSISSFMYVKRTVGAAYYNPLLDTLEVPGTTPAAALAGMMTASALGNAAVRLYQFEEPVNESGRASARIGAEFQTGASPLAGEENSRNIWRAVGYASNLLTKTLQPFILGTAMSSPALGANIVTAARQSATGTLLMAINGNDWDRSIAVDLRLYRTGNTISRYVAGQRGISTTLIPDSASDNVKLAAGEVAIWLLPLSSSTNYASSNPISAPALPNGATAAILHQAYIYTQDLDYQTSGIDCTSGCNVIADTNLGNVFYQFFFADNTGKVVSKSAVSLLSSQPRHSP